MCVSPSGKSCMLSSLGGGWDTLCGITVPQRLWGMPQCPRGPGGLSQGLRWAFAAVGHGQRCLGVGVGAEGSGPAPGPLGLLGTAGRRGWVPG